MDDLQRRWFEPLSVETAITGMLRKFRNVPHTQSDRVQNERDRLKAKYTMIAAGGAVAFLLVVIVALLLFAPKPEGREANYGGLAVLCILIVGGAAASTYFGCGNNNKKRAQRDDAFEELCRRHPGLRPARRAEFEDSSVGTVPWFHSEEWIHTYGMASGEHEGSQMIAVECTHVVDPILVSSDSRLLQGFAGLGSSKHKRLFLRAMDATIFVEPLPNVSDLLFVPRMDVSRAYYKRTLEHQDCDLNDVFKLPRALHKKYWMAAAAPEECGGLFATELPTLLASRKWCIVQVVGGHCVVMTSQWHGNHPGRAPSTAEAVSEDLAFAQAVFAQLRQFSTAATDEHTNGAKYTPAPTSGAPEIATSGGSNSTAFGYSAESTVGATAVAEPEANCPMPISRSAEPAAVTKETTAPKPRRRRPHSIVAKFCLLGLGVPLLLIGSIATVGFSVERQRGLAAGSWPQTDATIVDSGADSQTRRRSGQEVTRFKPRVSYTYEVGGQQFTGNRVKHGLESSTMSKHEVDRVLAKYSKDAVVNVHYIADSPDISVLEPGVQQISKLTVYPYVTGTFGLIGLLMSGYALIGKRR